MPPFVWSPLVTDKTMDPQSEFRETKRRNCWQSAHVSSCASRIE